MTKSASISQQNGEFVVRGKKPFILKKFIYNADEGSVMGRTGDSWLKVVVFYAAFYSVLAGLMAIQVFLFYRTLNVIIPKRILHDSIIGANPGMGFRPQSPEDFVQSTLIWSRPNDYEHLTKALDEFLMDYRMPYKRPGGARNIFNCDHIQPPPMDMVCDVNPKEFGPCIPENNYGYHRSSPCVLLKLNKIYGWIPEFYNSSTDLPNEMPSGLKHYIEELEGYDRQRLNTIWVSCEGKNAADMENIGPVEYFPGRGFPGYFYPYLNTEGYLSPLVAIHFARPARGININVECKAWARNIFHDRKDSLGSVAFELLID